MNLVKYIYWISIYNKLNLIELQIYYYFRVIFIIKIFANYKKVKIVKFKDFESINTKFTIIELFIINN